MQLDGAGWSLGLSVGDDAWSDNQGIWVCKRYPSRVVSDAIHWVPPYF